MALPLLGLPSAMGDRTGASGYGQEEDYHRTRAAGFDHHLVKPIDFLALSSLLANVVLILHVLIYFIFMLNKHIKIIK
jgi:hypothetical protein